MNTYIQAIELPSSGLIFQGQLNRQSDANSLVGLVRKACGDVNLTVIIDTMSSLSSLSLSFCAPRDLVGHDMKRAFQIPFKACAEENPGGASVG